VVIRTLRSPFVMPRIMLATSWRSKAPSSRTHAQHRGQLGGFTYYSWCSPRSSAAIRDHVIYGKLADLLGRKPVLIAGVVLLLIGSLLSPSPGHGLAHRVSNVQAWAREPSLHHMTGSATSTSWRARPQSGNDSRVWAVSGRVGFRSAPSRRQLSWAGFLDQSRSGALRSWIRVFRTRR